MEHRGCGRAVPRRRAGRRLPESTTCTSSATPSQWPATLPLAELEQRLHSLPEHPAWIPYRTSYYRGAGASACGTIRGRRCAPGSIASRSRASLAPGSLTYGEFAVPGRRIARRCCSSRTSVIRRSPTTTRAAWPWRPRWPQWIACEPRRYSYRFVFAPGTIGSLCWLKQNEHSLARVRAGLVLGLLGDLGSADVQDESRRRHSDGSRSRHYVLSQVDSPGRVHPVLALRLRRAAAVFAGLQPADRPADALGQRWLSRVPQLGGRPRADSARAASSKASRPASCSSPCSSRTGVMST